MEWGCPWKAVHFGWWEFSGLWTCILPFVLAASRFGCFSTCTYGGPPNSCVAITSFLETPIYSLVGFLRSWWRHIPWKTGIKTWRFKAYPSTFRVPYQAFGVLTSVSVSEYTCIMPHRTHYTSLFIWTVYFQWSDRIGPRDGYIVSSLDISLHPSGMMAEWKSIHAENNNSWKTHHSVCQGNRKNATTLRYHTRFCRKLYKHSQTFVILVLTPPRGVVASQLAWHFFGLLGG